MSSRGRYTPLRHVRLMLERQGGRCAVKGCETVLILGPRGQRTNFIVEHRQARARGGSNALKNKELRCKPHADEKTYHPRSKATTIGGDIFEIAKTKALKKAKLHVVDKTRRKRLLIAERNALAKGAKKAGEAFTAWLTPPKGWPKGRKLQGRGFPKVHRPMRAQ